MRHLDLDEARKRWPLLADLARKSSSDLTVELAEEAEEFNNLRPVNQKDKTVLKQQGGAEWALYVVGHDGSFSRVGTRFGFRVIYPARNLVIHEDVPDDIDEPGETVGEAIGRCVEPAKWFVLHQVGCDGHEREFNRVLIADGDTAKPNGMVPNR